MSKIRRMLMSNLGTLNKILIRGILVDENSWISYQKEEGEGKGATTSYKPQNKGISFTISTVEEMQSYDLKVSIKGKEVINEVRQNQSVSKSFRICLCKTTTSTMSNISGQPTDEYIIAETLEEFQSMLPLEFNIEITSKDEFSLSPVSIKYTYSNENANKVTDTYINSIIKNVTIFGGVLVDEAMYYKGE